MKSSGKCLMALITGKGVKPPRAQSEPNFSVWQRSVIKARFAADRSPRMILSMVSTPRVEPMRQGVHLPQDSIAQNSIANRACWPMSTVSSNTTKPPWPIMPPKAAKAS